MTPTSRTATAHFGDGTKFDVNIHWSRESDILGTAGGIKRAQNFLDGDSFLVINSDVLVNIDLQRVIDRLRQRFQTRVKIQGEGTRGRIEIEYFGDEDLQRITGMLLGDA